MAARSTCVGVGRGGGGGGGGVRGGGGGEEENIFEGDQILNHSISLEFWTMAGGGGGSTHFLMEQPLIGTCGTDSQSLHESTGCLSMSGYTNTYRWHVKK